MGSVCKTLNTKEIKVTECKLKDVLLNIGLLRVVSCV